MSDNRVVVSTGLVVTPEQQIEALKAEVDRFRKREPYVRALVGVCEDMGTSPPEWYALVGFEQDSGEW